MASEMLRLLALQRASRIRLAQYQFMLARMADDRPDDAVTVQMGEKVDAEIARLVDVEAQIAAAEALRAECVALGVDDP